MATITVPYVNVMQENEYWCWAAVVSNVYNSLPPPAPVTQCCVAQAVGQDCAYPFPFPLANGLNGLGIWGTEYDQVANFFEIILGELSGDENGVQVPVCAEVDFGADDDYIVHAVAITGIDPDTQQVWVADPYLGGDSVEFSLADFLSRYYYADNECGVVSVLETVFNKFQLSQS